MELLLKVIWADGPEEWIPNYELSSRPQCLEKMVKFYESKIKDRHKSK